MLDMDGLAILAAAVGPHYRGHGLRGGGARPPVGGVRRPACREAQLRRAQVDGVGAAHSWGRRRHGRRATQVAGRDTDDERARAPHGDAGRHLARRGLTEADERELVFVRRDGSPSEYSAWRRRVWVPATARAGMPKLRFHDLRHVAANVMVAEGVDIKTAQTRLAGSFGPAAHVCHGGDMALLPNLPRFPTLNDEETSVSKRTRSLDQAASQASSTSRRGHSGYRRFGPRRHSVDRVPRLPF